MARVEWAGDGKPDLDGNTNVRVWIHMSDYCAADIYENVASSWDWDWGGRTTPIIGDIIAYEVVESDPHGKKPGEAGAKLDAGKSPVRRGLLEYFPRACLAIAEISQFGARKYTWKGWETVPDGVDRYGDAEVRHICNAAIEGPITADSKKLHAAHEAWNALARLELILREQA